MKFDYYEAIRRRDNQSIKVQYMGESTNMKWERMWRDINTKKIYFESDLDMYGIRKRDIERARLQVLGEILSKISEEKNPAAFVLREYKEATRSLQGMDQQLQLEDILDLNNRYNILRTSLEQILERTKGLPDDLLSSYRWIIELANNALEADTNIKSITKL